MPIFRGRHARVSLHGGRADLKQLLRAETEGVYNKCVDGRIEQRTGREWSNMLVAVSAAEQIRDEFRHLVLAFSTIQHPIYFLELDFQPSERRQWFHSI